MSSTDTAFKCFQENLNLFGNHQAQPEKFNLYNGLSNIALAMAELQREVVLLRQEVADLRNKS